MPERPLFRADEERIPIVEETVAVGKREVETGRVRVHTVVEEENLNLTELLERDVVDIERVPVGREVEQAPLPFEEGDVLVIPIVEERVVVQKRLVVVEEVRIRRHHQQTQTEIPVTRRVMHAEIERSAPSSQPPGPPRSGIDPRRPMPGPGPAAAPLRGPNPSRAADPFEHAGSQDPRASRIQGGPQTRAEPNWAMIALIAATILLLLLAIASRS
jgi:uncharacterized protein (TIGR02271 family)